MADASEIHAELVAAIVATDEAAIRALSAPTSGNGIVVIEAIVTEEKETPPSDGAADDGPIGEELEVVVSAEEQANSVKVSLADLCAKGQMKYGHKDFESAAELFAQAAEMQAELHGDMHPDNGEILFYYGRALFKVGQSKSDVLGGRAPADKNGDGAAAAKKQKKKQANGRGNGEGSSSSKSQTVAGGEAERVAEEGVAIVAQQASSGLTKPEDALEGKKPLFQFTGDENFDDSDEEGGDAEAEDDEEEDDDDLAVAFEILDLARIVFNKKLDALTSTEDGASADEPTIRHVKERLADTHDLLAEISLENEKYPTAVMDFRASLNFKQDLYPQESEVMAEAHFKLSLALEFASVTTEAGEGADSSGQKPVDQALRDEAAAELEAAIASTRLKLQNKEVELATTHSPDDNDITRSQIADVKDIIADMEQRLVELKKPPIDLNETLGGVLGAALGETAAQSGARVEDVKKTATDLTGLVRKKNKQDKAPSPAAPSSSASSTLNGNGKRKAEDDPADAPTLTQDADDAAAASKKARVDEPAAAAEA